MSAYDDFAVENLRAAAAVRGMTIAQLATARCMAKVEEKRVAAGAQPISSGTWRCMSVELRAHLLTVATERADPLRDAAQGWSDFNQDEQIAIGALAREWRRQLVNAGWLR